MLKKTLTTIATIAVTPAFAHHPMDGATPSSLSQGLLSGIGHPVLGLDHLAFVLAVGVAALLAGSRFWLPLAFIGATIAGTLLHVAGIGLPLVEFATVCSVVAVGLLLASGSAVSFGTFASLFTIAGIFHGHAYGEAIYGAETTPLLAYLAGFGFTQWLIAIGAGMALSLARDATSVVPARVAGGMVAGAGMMLAGEQAIAAAFG